MNHTEKELWNVLRPLEDRIPPSLPEIVGPFMFCCALGGGEVGHQFIVVPFPLFMSIQTPKAVLDCHSLFSELLRHIVHSSDGSQPEVS